MGAMSEALCQRCGLCCDGTLFTRTPLEPGEAAPPPLVAAGAHLPQPCAALSGLRCTVYADRPRSCRRYECLLYGALAQGEVTLDEALAVVAEARARVAVDRGGAEGFLRQRFLGRAPRR